MYSRDDVVRGLFTQCERGHGLKLETKSYASSLCNGHPRNVVFRGDLVVAHIQVCSPYAITWHVDKSCVQARAEAFVSFYCGFGTN